LAYIQTTVQQNNLAVREILLEKPYTASSASQCPFDCPPEFNAQRWCDDKADKLFGKDTYRSAKDNFDELFDLVS
jgi:hypothetical protein